MLSNLRERRKARELEQIKKEEVEKNINENIENETKEEQIIEVDGKRKRTKIVHKIEIDYKILRVIPGIEQSELSTYAILKAICNLKDITRVLEREDKALYKTKEFEKVSYILDLKRDSVSFYFYVSKEFEVILRERINEVFKNCKIIEDKDFELPKERVFKQPKFKKKKLVQLEDNYYVEANEITYKYNDVYSLNYETKSSTLDSLIMNSKWLEDDERITLVYNIFPITQRDYNGLKDSAFTSLKHNNKEDLIKNKLSAEYLKTKAEKAAKGTFSMVFDIIDGLDKGYNAKVKEIDEEIKNRNPLDFLSSYSTQKIGSEKLGVQIVVMASGSNRNKVRTNLTSVTGAFSEYTNDNELIGKKTSPLKTLKIPQYNGVSINIMALKELQNFVAFPCNYTLSNNENVEHIKIQQKESRAFLESGNIYLGMNDYKGILKKIFMPSDYDSESLSHTYIAPQGSGKTTLIKNQCVDAFIAGQGGLLLDYIKNNELATSVEKIVSKIDRDRVIVLDASRPETMPKLDFAMFEINADSSCAEMGSAIDKKKEATIHLIDTLNPKQPLSTAMDRILSSACDVVYAQENTTFNDVIDVLSDVKTREYYINLADESYFADGVLNKRTEKAIERLKGINEYDKDGELIGTKEKKIEGIIDRIGQVEKSYLLSSMLYGAGKDLDFVDILDNNKLVIVKLPDYLVNDCEKNMISTFLVLMMLYATKIRGGKEEKPSRNNIWIDEVYQVRTVEGILADYINRLRKLGLKVVLTVHSIGQIQSQKLKRELLSSGGGLTLLSGCKEVQYNEVKDYMGEYSFEDVKNLDPRTGLHFVHSTSHGDWSGITKIPDWHKK